MSRADFDKFIERQQAEQKKAEAFDPKQHLQQWLDYLDALYKQINGYLEAYVTKGTAKIEYRDVQLNEDFIGQYTARQLLLNIGRSMVIFKPVGTMLIGSKGRVDVQGPRGNARLGLINKQATNARQLIRVTVSLPGDPAPSQPTPEEVAKIEWAWKIITPAPEMRFIDLTEDTFFDMILSVADA